MLRRLGVDPSTVRVHRSPQAKAAAFALGARAFTLGRDIYLGPTAPPPESAEGRKLMAHEMAHVAQGGDVLRRQTEPASRGPAFNEALTVGNLPRAVQLLGEMTPDERAAALAALSVTTLYDLHGYAGGTNESNAVEHDIEEAIARAPRQPSEPAPAPAIASLSPTEKLSRAVGYAADELGPAAGRELRNLLSPASLIAIAAFAALYIASQVTPVGWVADLLAIAVIATSVIFLGLMIFEIIADLGRFFAAVNATSEEDLRSAGRALARAVAKAGIGIIIALLTRGLGRGVGPPRPRPIAGFALATGEGGPAVMPVPATAAEAAPSAVQGVVASYAVMVPPPGGASAPSGGGAGPTPRGPEVFEELSEELGLATEESASGGGVRHAVSDAQAAGLIDAAGRPVGPVDLAMQSHGSAPTVRGELGLTGAQAQSAHVAPTSGMRGVSGYSRSGASTVLMEPAMHRAFDAHWQQWAMALRRGRHTDVSVGELYAEMLSAIEQIPGMAQSARNALAWRLQLELFSEIGLRPTDRVTLPYPNIPPAP